jgi:hypothetical protein
LGIARGTINIRPLRGHRPSAHKRESRNLTQANAHNTSRTQSKWRAWQKKEALSLLLITIYYSRITNCQRSDSIGAPSPPGRLTGPSNQNVNRVVRRFMAKVFRSFLSKIRIRQAPRPSVVLITKTNLSKALPERASVGRAGACPSFERLACQVGGVSTSSLSQTNRIAIVYAPSKPVTDES